LKGSRQDLLKQRKALRKEITELKVKHQKEKGLHKEVVQNLLAQITQLESERDLGKPDLIT
jgi:hypothetical protein